MGSKDTKVYGLGFRVSKDILHMQAFWFKTPQ